MASPPPGSPPTREPQPIQPSVESHVTATAMHGPTTDLTRHEASTAETLESRMVTPPTSATPGVSDAASAGASLHRHFSSASGHPAGTGIAVDADRATTDGASNEPICTAPQLRRFIKSRAYVPMHELRRRFGINGGEDDVTPVDVAGERVFVGLPGHEGRLLGELLTAGEVGYELSMDPRSPVIVGVYPMRPVPRH
jgi:hypothetical protein